jgi:Integrase core domain
VSSRQAALPAEFTLSPAFRRVAPSRYAKRPAEAGPGRPPCVRPKPALAAAAQTAGRSSIERFHQSLKKYLAKQEPATTKKLLQGQLNRFAASYNLERPHRSLRLRTPLEAWSAREKVGPVGPRIEAAGDRIRHDKVDTSGSVMLRYKGKLHHIGVGCPYAGWRVILLVAGLDVRILGLDGSPLRH